MLGYISSPLGYSSSPLGYISSTLGYISSTLGYISSTLGYILSTLGYISSTLGYISFHELKKNVTLQAWKTAKYPLHSRPPFQITTREIFTFQSQLSTNNKHNDETRQLTTCVCIDNGKKVNPFLPGSLLLSSYLGVKGNGVTRAPLQIPGLHDGMDPDVVLRVAITVKS